MGVGLCKGVGEPVGEQAPTHCNVREGGLPPGGERATRRWFRLERAEGRVRVQATQEGFLPRVREREAPGSSVVGAQATCAHD